MVWIGDCILREPSGPPVPAVPVLLCLEEDGGVGPFAGEHSTLYEGGGTEGGQSVIESSSSGDEMCQG